MKNNIYHGNLLNTSFKNEEFLKKYKILEKRKSNLDEWVHYLVAISVNELDDVIADIKANLLPTIYYAHLYNEDGSDIIVIFPLKVFRLSEKDEEGWKEVKRYMGEHGILIERWKDAKPKTFQEEVIYYADKPIV